MLKVGLTGSIAVGKSTVCGYLAEFGCHVIDADRTAREVVEKGTEGLRQIVEEFGIGVLQPNGELDRPALAEIVFNDEPKRMRLNGIVHPLVARRQAQILESLEKADPNGIAVVDAALMIESGGYRNFQKLVVVWCAEEVQMKRLMTRDSLSAADAKKRIAAQMSQEEKKTYADILIDTSGSLEQTRENTRSAFLELEIANR